MSANLKDLITPTFLYVIVLFIVFRSLFGTMLSDNYEKMSQNFMGFFLLRGPLKYHDSYVRCYKIFAVIILIISTIFYITSIVLIFHKSK
jgi:hypothetical protein